MNDDAGDSLDRLLADPDGYFQQVREQAVDDLRKESRGQVIRSSSNAGGSHAESGTDASDSQSTDFARF